MGKPGPLLIRPTLIKRAPDHKGIPNTARHSGTPMRRNFAANCQICGIFELCVLRSIL
jgi:hypothetical protein